MAWNDVTPTGVTSPPVSPVEDAKVLYSDEDVLRDMKAGALPASKVFCLVYGDDGEGKTGVVYDYLTPNDVKTGMRMVVIDLDGGGRPLKDTYHKDKGEALIVIDPLVTMETSDGTMIDYARTFAKVRAIIRYVKSNYVKDKIKAIVFDGLSTALTYAAEQMRLDKNLDPDGGVQTRYWLLRNKLFLETLDQIKMIPIAKFFIAHKNFIVIGENDKGEKSPSVVMKTNALMMQKIRCKRESTKEGIVFSATFDKNKYKVASEGSTSIFCKVNKADKKVSWDTSEIYKNME